MEDFFLILSNNIFLLITTNFESVVNRQQFYFILSLIKETFTNEPSLRVLDPITFNE